MRRWQLCPFGVSQQEVAIVSIRSKSCRRWLLCPFGVSHEEVAIVSIRSKS